MQRSKASTTPYTMTGTPSPGQPLLPRLSLVALIAFIFCTAIALIITLPRLPNPTTHELWRTFATSYTIGFGTVLLSYLGARILAPQLRRRHWSPIRTFLILQIPANFIVNIFVALLTLPEPGEGSPIGYMITWLIISLVIATMASMTFIAVDWTLREIGRGREALRRNAAMAQELMLAHDIQEKMLPKAAPNVPGLQIAGGCYPAREVGGDLLGYHTLPDGRVSISIGDVSGKSVSAAMLMGITLGALQAEVRDHLEPALVLEELNGWIADQTGGQRFVAIANALIDPAAGRMLLANAGQLYPILRRDNTVIELEVPPSLPLGSRMPLKLQQREIELRQGDIVVFFTDGIVEAHSPTRELFGFDRIYRLLAELPLDSSAERIHHTIVETVQRFTAGYEQHDDMTIVVVRVL
jgi:serine phosphatase RsbU (regulator of sigma subunit)